MIPIIVITHGLFGQELVRTAEEIVGRQEETAALAVTSTIGPDELSRSVAQIINTFPASDGLLFLVDMLGGTPCNVATLKMRDAHAEIVAGVNLYMVLSAFRNRSGMDLESLAAKVAEDGRRSIVLPKDLLRKKMGSS